MKGKKIIGAVCICLLLIVGCSSKLKGISDRIDKGVYSNNDLAKINQVIEKQPNNPLANLCLGGYKLQSGKINSRDGALNYFQNAINLAGAADKKSIAYKIGQWIQKECIVQLTDSQKNLSEITNLADIGKKFDKDPSYTKNFAQSVLLEAHPLTLNPSEFSKADRYYKLAIYLDKTKADSAANRFLEIFNQDVSRQIKGEAIEFALSYKGRDSEIQKKYAEFQYQQSQRANNLEEKCEHLERATKYNAGYKHELLVARKQLQEEKLLAKVHEQEKKWGPAKYVEVNWSNWKKETELPHTGKIYFFSTGHVMMKDSDWNMAIKGRIRTNEIGYIEFTSRRKMDIYFKMADRPAKIWYWPNPALS